MSLKTLRLLLVQLQKPTIIFLISIVLFLVSGLYHLIFSQITFDEVNYLVKGRAFISDGYRPYQYYSFYTDYPPLSYYLIGITQVFSQNIFTARFFSFSLLITIFALTVYAGFKIGGKRLAALAAILLALSFNFSKIFIQLPPYPQSALLILLAIVLLIQIPKNRLIRFVAIFFLVLASFIRLQAFVTLLIVVVYLVFQSKSFYHKIVLVLFPLIATIILALPFYPEITRIIFQTPLFGFLSTQISGVYSLRLSIFYKDVTLAKRVFALYRFFIYYSSIIFFSGFLLLVALRVKKIKLVSIPFSIRSLKIEGLLILIILINVAVVLFVSFFSLCPACSITYLSLILPLIILSIGWEIISVYDSITTSEAKVFFKVIILIGVLWVFIPTPYHQLTLPYLPPPTFKVMQTARELKQLIPKNEKVFTLGGQQYWYFANLATFPPLVNGLYTFRDSTNTAELSKYGYWNKELALIWAKEANWALIDERQIDELTRGGENTRDLVQELEIILEENFRPITRITGQSGEKISIYKKFT